MKIRFLLTFCITLSLLLVPMSRASQATKVSEIQMAGKTYTKSPLTPGETDFLIETEDLVNNFTYLPIVFKTYPLIPATPVLNAISNADGDGSYSVSWSLSEGADTYTLEEDDNLDFSSPTTVHFGASTSKDISGRDIGMYYYRVRASNAYASSNWSNIVEVEVTVPLPDCPQAGEWSGTTSQGGHIYFQVEKTPQCQVKNLSISSLICFPPYDYFKQVYWTGWVFPILDNNFTTGTGINRVTGFFSSITTANGDFSIQWERFVPYYQTCQSTGTWTANP